MSRPLIVLAALAASATLVLASPAGAAVVHSCPNGAGLLHGGYIAHDDGGTRVTALRTIGVRPRIAQGGGAPPIQPCYVAGEIAENVVYVLDKGSGKFVKSVALGPDGQLWRLSYRGEPGRLLAESQRVEATARHGRGTVTMTLVF